MHVLFSSNVLNSAQLSKKMPIQQKKQEDYICRPPEPLLNPLLFLQKLISLSIILNSIQHTHFFLIILFSPLFFTYFATYRIIHAPSLLSTSTFIRILTFRFHTLRNNVRILIYTISTRCLPQNHTILHRR